MTNFATALFNRGHSDEACRWYRQAAEEHNPRGLFYHAICLYFFSGGGSAAAEAPLLRSAHAGHALAQSRKQLPRMLSEVDGVP